MTFRGWPPEAPEFFEGLEADNSKSYWRGNKAVYDTLVRRPLGELIAELTPEWGEGRIFRPHTELGSITTVFRPVHLKRLPRPTAPAS